MSFRIVYRRVVCKFTSGFRSLLLVRGGCKGEIRKGGNVCIPRPHQNSDWEQGKALGLYPEISRKTARTVSLCSLYAATHRYRGAFPLYAELPSVNRHLIGANLGTS